MTIRGKTTPASTPGSYAAKAGATSRVAVPGWDRSLSDAMRDVAAGCDTPEAAMAVLDGALAAYCTECDECGQPMWTDIEGGTFHTGHGRNTVNWDLDADHVAACADIAHLDPIKPDHASLVEAVTAVCEGFPQHGHDIRDRGREIIRGQFAGLINERRSMLKAAVRDHATNTAPRRWGINVLIDSESSKHVTGRWASGHVVGVVLDDFGQPANVDFDAYEQLVADTRYAHGDPDRIIVYGRTCTYHDFGITFRHLAADGRILSQ